jgi:GcrA cell cycle regulator
MSSNTSDAWHSAAVAKLIELWPNHTTREIARQMGEGYTPDMVQGKAHRLNLPAKASPIRRNGIEKITPTRYLEHGSLPPLPRTGIFANHYRPPAVTPASECQFPLGERPYSFCCSPVVPGKSYCPKHFDLCTIKLVRNENGRLQNDRR